MTIRQSAQGIFVMYWDAFMGESLLSPDGLWKLVQCSKECSNPVWIPADSVVHGAVNLSIFACQKCSRERNK